MASLWHELHGRSVEDVAWFTDAMLRYLDIQFDQPYSKFSTCRPASRGRAGASAAR